MSKISFEGIGEVAATFACEAGVQAGQVVGLTGDGTVGPCESGGRICGVALSSEDGYAAVQIGGLCRVARTGEEVTPGFAKLSADGAGGMKQDAAGGTEYLVLWVESDGMVIRL